jgi:hypothetical protein
MLFLHLNSLKRNCLKFIQCIIISKNSEAEIGPKTTKDFKMTFKCNSEGRHTALIVAYPILSNASITSNNKIKLTELALKIDALGISPLITVDKSVIFQ